MTAMQVWKANAVANEGPRSHTHIGGQRVPPRPPDGEPSAVRGHCGREDAPGHGGRKPRRRHLNGNACGDQTPIRSARQAVSFRLSWGGNWKIRFQDETERCRAFALLSVQEGQGGHLRPNMPWCSARQDALPFVGRHPLDAFEVKFYARRQRRLRLFERRAVCRDIEIGADCMPLVAADTSVTSQREVHFGVPLEVPTTVGQPITAVASWPVQGRRRIE